MGLLELCEVLQGSLTQQLSSTLAGSVASPTAPVLTETPRHGKTSDAVPSPGSPQLRWWWWGAEVLMGVCVRLWEVPSFDSLIPLLILSDAFSSSYPSLPSLSKQWEEGFRRDISYVVLDLTWEVYIHI